MTMIVVFTDGRELPVATTPATYAADKAQWEANPNVDYVK